MRAPLQPAAAVPTACPRPRGRFAPSPSGPLHFGSLVTALASWLAARADGGEWLLRIEDIDTPRVVPDAADAILRVLESFGLDWDGEVVYQSRRLEQYQVALDRLLVAGLAYPCTCSRRELALSARHGCYGAVYPGTCRNGTAGGRPAAMRLYTDDRFIGFDDLIQGTFGQRLETEVGDFVIYRADGIFAYQLAVVVDDADQGVTHIVRGSDLLDSTPRQIYLQHLLGLPTPAYTHLPVAVDARGFKLSKQTGAPPVDPHRPGRVLFDALQFLGQDPPPGLARAPVAAILRWALAHWRMARIPAATTARPWSPAAATPPAPATAALF